jgi:hypothetical protein
LMSNLSFVPYTEISTPYKPKNTVDLTHYQVCFLIYLRWSKSFLNKKFVQQKRSMCIMLWNFCCVVSMRDLHALIWVILRPLIEAFRINTSKITILSIFCIYNRLPT